MSLSLPCSRAGKEGGSRKKGGVEKREGVEKKKGAREEEHCKNSCVNKLQRLNHTPFCVKCVSHSPSPVCCTRWQLIKNKVVCTAHNIFYSDEEGGRYNFIP
jgi:hypothetical protein